MEDLKGVMDSEDDNFPESKSFEVKDVVAKLLGKVMPVYNLGTNKERLSNLNGYCDLVYNSIEQVIGPVASLPDPQPGVGRSQAQEIFRTWARHELWEVKQMIDGILDGWEPNQGIEGDPEE